MHALCLATAVATANALQRRASKCCTVQLPPARALLSCPSSFWLACSGALRPAWAMAPSRTK